MRTKYFYGLFFAFIIIFQYQSISKNIIKQAGGIILYYSYRPVTPVTII